MKCTQCSFHDTKVIESRDVAEGEATRRRRLCPDCNYRFTTYERLERPQLIVVKNDGKRQMFSRDKLLGGLYRACEKTPVTTLQIERVVLDIERQLYACGEPEVSSGRIGELVMERLSMLNDVAYVRFASVYRRFKDIESFEREVLRLRDKGDKADKPVTGDADRTGDRGTKLELVKE